MSILNVNGLSKKYPSFQLSDISFALEAGRIVGFAGRNGAGKTTTIKSMLNLIHPDAGEITYFDMPLIGHEGNQTANRIFHGNRQLVSQKKTERNCFSYQKLLSELE